MKFFKKILKCFCIPVEEKETAIDFYIKMKKRDKFVNVQVHQSDLVDENFKGLEYCIEELNENSVQLKGKVGELATGGEYELLHPVFARGKYYAYFKDLGFEFTFGVDKRENAYYPIKTKLKISDNNIMWSELNADANDQIKEMFEKELLNNLKFRFGYKLSQFLWYRSIFLPYFGVVSDPLME